MLICELLALWCLARTAALALRLPWHERTTPIIDKIPQRAAVPFGIATVVLYIVQNITAGANARTVPGCLHGLPFRLNVFSPVASEMQLGIAVLQSLALLALAASLSRGKIQRRENAFLAGLCAIMIAVAIATPVIGSTDVLTYRLIGGLGRAAYIPADALTIRHGTEIVHTCGPRFLPVAYGPAFMWYAQGVAAITPDYAAGTYVFRGFGALWFVAALGLLRVLKAPGPLIVLVALNPVVLSEYVADAHNDLIGVVIALLGFVAVRRSAWLAAVCIVLAGCIKLPLAVAALLALSAVPSVKLRAGMSVASLVAVLALTYAFAGPAYFAGLVWLSRTLSAYMSAVNMDIRVTLQALAIAGVLAAVFRRRFAAPVPYLMLALAGGIVQPWYALWPLPYVLQERKHAKLFLATLPLFAILANGLIDNRVQFVLFLGIGIALARGFVTRITGSPLMPEPALAARDAGS